MVVAKLAGVPRFETLFGLSTGGEDVPRSETFFRVLGTAI